MLFRFSLYGFLKNQRYFEPFLYLALLEKGLDFFAIGLLIAARELAVNLVEIPSGAAADLFGRRRLMIFSFLAYIASFVMLGAAESIWLLALGMLLFGVGDSFRTGTHKAMIFAWLRTQGRTHERTMVYGYTRSWSKYGSAVSVVLAAVFVFVSGGYSIVFYLAAIPYVLGIINFAGYPAEVDVPARAPLSLGAVARHTCRTLREAIGRRDLRRLIGESMGFEGVFDAVKDYLQPVLQAAAIGLAAGYGFGGDMSEIQRTCLIVGPVYLVLHLMSGIASRRAHRLVIFTGGEDNAARLIWMIAMILFAALLIAGVFDVIWSIIFAFVLLHVLQNYWRPILISRFDDHSEEAQAATVLSIESQSQRAATMVLAPLVGLAVDTVQKADWGGAFWPIGALGLSVSLAFFVSARRTASVTPLGSHDASIRP